MLRTPAIADRAALANLLGLPANALGRYIHRADKHYKQFRVRKRSGHGYRTICAPSRELKGIQRWIVSFILRRVQVSAQSTAFRPNCSILGNASCHIGRDFVLNVDMADFFPTVTTRRVLGLFRALGYPAGVSWALARLTTFEGQLPQGAPSSPEIANIICWCLDARLGAMCSSRGWTYTRYCDDITVSGTGSPDRAHGLVERIVREEGFLLNPRKTHVMRRTMRQQVTGLVVNTRPNIGRHARKTWRALFHQAGLDPARFAHRIPELQGYLAFLRMVRPDDPAGDRYAGVIAQLRGHHAGT